MNTSNSKRFIAPFATLVAAALFAPTITYANPTKTPKVLMVLSSYGERDSDNKLIKPGYEFDELSKAYLVFKHHGIDITLASPKGGKPIADDYNTDKPYVKAFLQDKNATDALAATLPIDAVKPQQYDAVFVVGGKGPMFDLANNTALQTSIRTIYENNGVVSAVCHGPAALVNVTLSDGSLLLAGKRVTGFTLEEEAAFSKKWAAQFSFQLEEKLKQQGANFVQDGLMLNQVSIDGRIITGQNPFSTADTAKAVVAKLGITPSATLTFKDDETIKLVEAFFENIHAATAQYNAAPDAYDTMLLAMFGYYQAQHANTQHQRAVAISLMALSQEKIQHPMLILGLANAYLDNQQIQQAVSLLQQANKQFPDDDALKAMLNKVTL